MKCGRALLGELHPGLKSWEQTCARLLLEGDIDGLVSQLMDCMEHAEDEAQFKALDALVRYVRNNQRRMNFPHYRARGFLIGSGVVESAHRHVIHTRMKRAGQHWSEQGARQMARMRAAYRTCGPERFYESIHWAHRETMKNHDVLNSMRASAKPPKRRASNR